VNGLANLRIETNLSLIYLRFRILRDCNKIIVKTFLILSLEVVKKQFANGRCDNYQKHRSNKFDLFFDD
jgi:hypothetical protein